MRRRIAIASAVVALSALTGCSVDLGPCNEAVLGGVNLPGNAQPNAGQVVIQSNCAASRCHSVNAVGEARVGVPAGLNFDVVPAASTPVEFDKARAGTTNVQDRADEIWGEVEGGSMPPEGQGELSGDDKETLRNWLACGAPVIAAPLGGGADWAGIYQTLEIQCLGCHGTTVPPEVSAGFALGDRGDPCGAWRNVYMRVAVTQAGGCAGNATLVLPGAPASSLLLQKLLGTQSCGGSMPAGSPMPLGVTNPQLAMDVTSWINAGALPPPGCM